MSYRDELISVGRSLGYRQTGSQKCKKVRFKVSIDFEELCHASGKGYGYVQIFENI